MACGQPARYPQAMAGGRLFGPAWVESCRSAPAHPPRRPTNLRISAPQIRFLTGKALEQLKSGANVGFVSQISHAAHRIGLQFAVAARWTVLSSATTSGRRSSPRRVRVHLCAESARLSVPAARPGAWTNCCRSRRRLPLDRPVLDKIGVRAEDPKEWAAIVGEPGINLNRLVEIFSRPPRNAQQRWTETAGPLRLQDL